MDDITNCLDYLFRKIDTQAFIFILNWGRMNYQPRHELPILKTPHLYLSHKKKKKNPHFASLITILIMSVLCGSNQMTTKNSSQLPTVLVSPYK